MNCSLLNKQDHFADILAGKNILITAGPVWVPIDRVRVMTNIFGGALGFVIAKTAYAMGANVKLLMGPGRIDLPDSVVGLEIIKFKYFDELFERVKKQVSTKSCDVVIKSAAVADYVPIKVHSGKIKSGCDTLTIQFKKTPKIVDQIKAWDPDVFLVKFKLEVDLSQNELIDIAYKSMLHSQADLIVANEFGMVSNNHSALIIDPARNITTCQGKREIAEQLLKTIAMRLFTGQCTGS